MARPRVGKQRAVIPSDYTAPIAFRAVARIVARSASLRGFFFGLLAGRVRTALFARYFWVVVTDIGQGRFKGILPLIHPEAEVNLFSLGNYRGRDGWKEALKSFLDTIPPEDLRLTEYIDAGGGKVVLIWQWTGQSALSGVPVDQTTAFLVEIRDGYAVAGELFRTTQSAPKAAGVSE